MIKCCCRIFQLIMDILVFRFKFHLRVFLSVQLTIRQHLAGHGLSTIRQAIIWTPYSDVIMSTMAYQITGVSVVCSVVCSGADQRKQQSSASPVIGGSPHKGPVTPKMFPFDDVIMWWWLSLLIHLYVTRARWNVRTGTDLNYETTVITRLVVVDDNDKLSNKR